MATTSATYDKDINKFTYIDGNSVNNVFSKTIKLTTMDGDTTVLTGAAAAGMQKKLEDNPNFSRIVDGAPGRITFYNLNPSACGICKVATVIPEGKREDNLECEDALGCPED